MLDNVKRVLPLREKKRRRGVRDRSKEVRERTKIDHGKLLSKKGNNVTKEYRGGCSENDIIYIQKEIGSVSRGSVDN